MKADNKVLKSELDYVKKFMVHNFGEASLAMISQAAPLFGEQMDDLMRKRTTIDGRKSVVEIGESTVVDETPTKQP